MARDIERLNRTIEFWSSRSGKRYLLTEDAVRLLGETILRIAKVRHFTLEHVNALSLAVSLLEAQMKDCLRLAIDEQHRSLDEKSEFFQFKIDPHLFSHFRSRRLSLGQFVFANTTISTVEKLWAAIAFCFMGDIEDDYNSYVEAQNLSNANSLKEVKAAIARVYEQRNIFTHEFFDHVASQIGKELNDGLFISDLRDTSNFLIFLQALKQKEFTRSYWEDHPSYGPVAKKLNAAYARVDSLIEEILKLIHMVKAQHGDDYTWHHDGLFEHFTVLNSVADEYFFALSSFRSMCSTEGTMANDFMVYNMLQEVELFENHLKEAKASLLELTELNANLFES